MNKKGFFLDWNLQRIDYVLILLWAFSHSVALMIEWAFLKYISPLGQDIFMMFPLSWTEHNLNSELNLLIHCLLSDNNFEALEPSFFAAVLVSVAKQTTSVPKTLGLKNFFNDKQAPVFFFSRSTSEKKYSNSPSILRVCFLEVRWLLVWSDAPLTLSFNVFSIFSLTWYDSVERVSIYHTDLPFPENLFEDMEWLSLYWTFSKFNTSTPWPLLLLLL